MHTAVLVIGACLATGVITLGIGLTTVLYLAGDLLRSADSSPADRWRAGVADQ